MANQGTTSTTSGASAAAELVLPEWDPGKPRRAQLEEMLRAAVRDGRLRPGSRLPSSRALAAQLAISRRLAVEVYEQLAAEGYLVAVRGSGTRVAAGAGSGSIDPEPPPPEPLLYPETGISLFPGAPELSLFPRRAWGRALRRALATLPDARLGYGEFAGTTELRVALAEYVGRARAADAAAARIVVTNGFQQGLRLFCALVRGRGGTRVAVEDPGYPATGWTLEAERLEVVPIAVDDEGLDVAALAAADPDAVVVTPAHALPTGAVLAPARRRALVAWARRRRALVLEDDYDAELRYDRGPAGTLQGLAPEVVVLAGTVSKTLAPALRLGWLLLPGELVPAAVAGRAADDGGGPRLEELALAELLASGGFDRHLRAARQRYRAKRAILLEALAVALPQARVGGVAAGLHALLELPQGSDEGVVVAACREREVHLQGLADFTRLHRRDPALVLGYGLPSERQLREAVAVIAAAVESTPTSA